MRNVPCPSGRALPSLRSRVATPSTCRRPGLSARRAPGLADASMAHRCGDPAARMLGRITLNAIEHIDPCGTVLVPGVDVYTVIAVLGWAKPTPVDPRNFEDQVVDVILTAV